jgi:hypothetical protein
MKDRPKDMLLIEQIGVDWINSNKPITRVEFRVGRTALRRFGVNTMSDLFEREQGIVNILTHDWFRFLREPKVRGTENKAEVHPVWERVRSLFFRYFSGSEVKDVKWETPSVVCDSAALIKQGMGCLMSAVAKQFGEQEHAYQIEDVIRSMFRDDQFHYLQKVNKRVRQTETLTGVRLGKHDAEPDEVNYGMSNPADRQDGWARFHKPPEFRWRR